VSASDLREPLLFPRNFNRISGPDSNSCSGCHNKPYTGGGGDSAANVFVLGQRFDFATFSQMDSVPTKNALDERGQAVTLQTLANSRKTIGMFGSGYIEMLARQITAELQTIRNTLQPGQSSNLSAKGINFGVLRRTADGQWDTSSVDGIAALSMKSAGTGDPPSLIIRPFHQAGNVISLREFTTAPSITITEFNRKSGLESAPTLMAMSSPMN